MDGCWATSWSSERQDIADCGQLRRWAARQDAQWVDVLNYRFFGEQRRQILPTPAAALQRKTDQQRAGNNGGGNSD